jgi:tetratricopeptide (TPR) repeat protein
MTPRAPHPRRPGAIREGLPRRARFSAWLAVATLAGCAWLAPLSPEEALARRAVSDNQAVIALADSSRTEAAAERFASAAAALERALRIEPRNPRLWYELGRLKFLEGDYAQAAGLAARANTWAGTDRLLRAANWRLLGAARQATGDEAGARAAYDKAETFMR